MVSEEKLLLTPDEVCDQLGVKRSNLWKMMASGEIPSVKIGKLRRIPFAALKAWVERQVTNAGRDDEREEKDHRE